MIQKSSQSNFCLTNFRNLKVFLEVHGRDIAFAKSEQSYHLTSTDAEAAAVRLLLPLHRKRHIPESYACILKRKRNATISKMVVPSFSSKKSASDKEIAKNRYLPCIQHKVGPL